MWCLSILLFQHIDKSQLAKEIWTQYVHAIQNYDSLKAYRYWVKKDRQNGWIDLNLGKISDKNDKLRYFNQHCAYKIKEIKDKGEYIELIITVYEKDTPIAEEQRYMVFENDSLKLVTPLTLFTKDWHTHRYGKIEFIYEGSDSPTLKDVKRLEKTCKLLEDMFDIHLGKIWFFKVRNANYVAKLTGFPPRGGYAFPDAHVVVSSNYLPHEIVHVYMHKINPSVYINPVLQEGIAVAIGGGAFATNECLMSLAQDLIQMGKGSLTSILYPDSFRIRKDIVESYMLAGSFCNFLLEKFGAKKFKELYSYPHNYFADTIEIGLHKIYGKSIKNLEEYWHSWAVAKKLPKLKPGISKNSQVDFEMDDPLYDDTGDGDYTYPSSASYPKGILDLKHFEVSHDDSTVYFKLEFRKLAHPDSEWGFWGTLAMILIDTSYDASWNYKEMYRWILNTRIPDNYEFAIIIHGDGACVLDNSMITLGALMYKTESYGKMRAGPHTIGIGVPIRLIGRPSKNWRYIVAVCAQEPLPKTFRYNIGGAIHVEEKSTGSTCGGANNPNAPYIFDLLAPTKEEQIKILSNYNDEKKVSIPYVKPVSSW